MGTRREIPRRLVTKAQAGSGSVRAGEAMMNKDLIYVIEQIGREKGIGKEVLFEALESALLSASKKTMGAGRQRADGDRPPDRRRSGSSPARRS